MLNVKPSRFESLEALLDAYDYMERRGTAAYGGRQFELGPGRGQIQALASLFHRKAERRRARRRQCAGSRFGAACEPARAWLSPAASVVTADTLPT